MKKVVLAILLVNSCVVLKAQHVRLGVYASPTLNVTLGLGGSGQLLSDRLKPKFGYSTGVEAIIPLNSRVLLRTGVNYSIHNLQRSNDLVVRPTMDIMRFNDQKRFQEIGLPLHLLFRQKEHPIYFGIGLSINRLGVRFIEPGLPNTDIPYFYSGISISPYLAAGYTKQVGRYGEVYLEPFSSYVREPAFGSVFMTSQMHAINMGLRIGYTYKIGRK